MEPWYKFILYGTYDGFSRSTLGDDNLYLVLENGEKVEIPRCFVKNASDFIEKDKLKLKDVIARIQKLDLGTQKVWLNEILNELGSDYGASKYKDGYEQGKLEGEWVGQQLKDADKIRQELNKQMIPQFVADWIEDCKTKGKSLLKSLLYTPGKVNSWVDDPDNQETFALAWINGYEVEQEKRYSVKIKGEIEENLLVYGLGINRYFFARTYDSSKRNEHTRKELEKAGFGWVLDCEGIELEEVKE